MAKAKILVFNPRDNVGLYNSIGNKCCEVEAVIIDRPGPISKMPKKRPRRVETHGRYTYR